MTMPYRKPSAAFIGASWVALVDVRPVLRRVGAEERARPRRRHPINIDYGLSSISVLLCIVLMAAGLWNGRISLPEKGFYGMAYLLSLFAAITVQKNTRDSVDPAEIAVAPPDLSL